MPNKRLQSSFEEQKNHKKVEKSSSRICTEIEKEKDMETESQGQVATNNIESQISPEFEINQNHQHFEFWLPNDYTHLKQLQLQLEQSPPQSQLGTLSCSNYNSLSKIEDDNFELMSLENLKPVPLTRQTGYYYSVFKFPNELLLSK